MCIQTIKFTVCLLILLSTHTDDATRVKLLEGPDYINANYVNVSMSLIMCEQLGSQAVIEHLTAYYDY